MNPSTPEHTPAPSGPASSKRLARRLRLRRWARRSSWLRLWLARTAGGTPERGGRSPWPPATVRSREVHPGGFPDQHALPAAEPGVSAGPAASWAEPAWTRPARLCFELSRHLRRRCWEEIVSQAG